MLKFLRGTEGLIDDNDFDMYSASASWEGGDLSLGAAYINYSALYGGSRISAYRLATDYTLGAAKIGVIYENIDANDYLQLDRPAYGVLASYNITPTTIAGLQWMHANETELGNDEADQVAVGLFHSLSEALLVHAVYTKTINGEDARYRTADYAHGDRINTVPDGDPFAFSVGAQYRF